MAKQDDDFPSRELSPPETEEFPQPRPETEFRPPDAAAEDSAAPGEDYVNPDETAEFSSPGSGRAEESAPALRKRRLRRLLYGAAALVLLGLLFADRGAEPIPAAVVTATAAPVYTSDSDIPLPTVAPTPEPAPTPTPPPPEPLSTELECHPVFFNFSAMHYGFVKLINQQDVTAARAEIWETNFESLEWSRDLTSGEIEIGYFALPEFDDSDTYFKYMDKYEKQNLFPEFELRVTLSVAGEDGPKTLSFAQRAVEEQGWSVQYWPADYEPFWSGQEYYPDCFAVMSYEATGAPPAMRMGSYLEAQDSRAICVELELNGVPVPAESARIVTREEPIYRQNEKGELVETGEKYYYSSVVIPRPADAPLSGSAHFTVSQYLEEFDLVWVSNRDLEYGK